MRAFADRHSIVLLQHFIHLSQELTHARPIAVLEPSKLPLTLRIRDRRIRHIALTVHIHSINAEPINAALKPEFHSRLVDSLARGGILPVEVRLLGAEEMEIVLFSMLVPLPDGAAEVSEPVVGRVSLAVDVPCGPPDVPVALGVVF